MAIKIEKTADPVQESPAPGTMAAEATPAEAAPEAIAQEVIAQPAAATHSINPRIVPEEHK